MIKSPPDSQSFIDARQLGLKGLNFLLDPQDLTDQDSPNLQNVVFDTGLITPRGGTRVFAEKPTGETLDALQGMVAKNSLGTEFMLAIYGNHFYLRDENNDRWIYLNNLYTPAETTFFYGYTSWNAGLGNDTFYFGNGHDNSAKWPVALQELTVAGVAGDTTITVDDGVPFPASGVIVLYDGSTRTVKTYTSKAGNVLTLSGTLGVSAAIGTSVTMSVLEAATLPLAKIFVTSGLRLYAANGYQEETTLSYSATDDPEDFTPGSGPDEAGVENITDGNGPITDMGDFGEYLLVSKDNTYLKFTLTINSVGDGKLITVKALISGKGMGPRDIGAAIKVENSIYAVSPTNDVYQISPSQTGASSSVKSTNISTIIKPYIKTLSFANTRCAYNDQKIFWLYAEGVANNSVLVRDLVRDAWTKFYGWNAKDIFSKGNSLFYIDRTSGIIYEALVGNDDAQQGYTSFFFTKRFNFGKASMPKTEDKVYVEGYVRLTSSFFIDVFYDENGKLAKSTFRIDGSSAYTQTLASGAWGAMPFGTFPLGLATGADIGTFRVYLAIPNKYGFFNIQFKIYSQAAGSLWGISGLASNPIIEPIAPPLMAIDPIT